MIRTTTRIQYANGYLELGMLSEAETELDAITETDRSDPDVLALRCRIFMERQNWELMEGIARHLAQNAPESPFGWVHWAYALREQENIEEARTIARKGAQLHPEDAVLQFNLSCYHSLLGDLDKSFACLQRAVELEPSFQEDAKTDPDLANLRKTHNAN